MAEENDNIIKRTVSSVAELAGRASGKELADRVDAFTETYGEVLVGMHHEIERQKKELEESSRREIETSTRIDALEASTKALTSAADVGIKLNRVTDTLVELQSEIISARKRQAMMLIALFVIAVVSILAAIFL